MAAKLFPAKKQLASYSAVFRPRKSQAQSPVTTSVVKAQPMPLAILTSHIQTKQLQGSSLKCKEPQQQQTLKTTLFGKANLVKILRSISQTKRLNGETRFLRPRARKVQLHTNQQTNVPAHITEAVAETRRQTRGQKVHPLGRGSSSVIGMPNGMLKEYADYLLHEDLATVNSFKKNWLTHLLQPLKSNAQ